MNRERAILYIEFSLLLAFHIWILAFAARWVSSWL
jgi:hypothetical protein|tara:strand:+ start:477 stop:581 length:105 start_codon:yes stop_codon:yes gene_type:complete